MKDLIVAIIYLQDILSESIKDFSTPLEDLQSNGDPIEEVSYYKGFTDAIYRLKKFYFNSKENEN